MEKKFERLVEMINELMTTNSTLEKKNILSKYEDCKDFLYYTYNSFIKFGVTSETVKKKSELINPRIKSNDIFEILDLLHKRKVTGHEAIATINYFISLYPQYSEYVYRILDRDLQVRMGSTEINKVFKGLIPTFDVALANKFDPDKHTISDKSGYLASRKMDGVRTLVFIYDKENIIAVSRENREFTTLGRIKEEIADLIDIDHYGYVLDGETCIIDENGNENFQAIMKEIKRKNHTIENPRYNVFDFIPMEVFFGNDKGQKLIPRINEFYKTKLTQAKYIRCIEQKPVSSNEEVALLLEEAESKGWEGLILRKNEYYKGKRSDDLLKVKKMQDAEFKITDIHIDMIDDGKGNKVEGLAAVSIDYNGYNVKVGSGWSFDERIYYKNNPNELIGKMMCVQYFEATENQNGGKSLRFPIKKHIYGEKRTL